MEPDVLRAVIQRLSAELDVWVADVFPAADELEDNLPCVRVDEVPGTSRLIPWQVTGEAEIQELGIDIDVLGRSRHQTRGIRERIHKLMMTMPQDLAEVTSVRAAATFHTRPDFNHLIRRVGAEYLVSARTG